MEKEKSISRAWCDGCFDMVHFGHANFLRQASKMCDELYVGVHNDEEIAKNKGPPVMTMEERITMVEGIKWVKKAVPDSPYITTLHTLEDHKCDFCIHGDDVTLDASGQDTYRYVREAGRFKECPRTKGVSTTNLVGRMLLLTKEHHRPATPTLQSQSQEKSPYTGTCSDSIDLTDEVQRDFLQGREPKEGDRVIYVAGAFDLFHAGHVEFLQKARAMGDFLVVGLHSDTDVNRYLGKNYPIVTLVERALSVGACRYVDKLIFPAPFVVDQEFLDQVKPTKIVHGQHYRASSDLSMYELPKRLGIYEELNSGSPLTTEIIMSRIIKNRGEFEERNRKKQLKELNYLASS
ncbi:ethanolamine-phosphate cytidylyltransferase-like [Sycon ciliatum]|uniref:ethanolamine-phosphate cytidylyltransferase-like n=1 Tax=Sycon ciliatum TaxID=27933 RepID=UPI0031F703B9